MHEEKREGTSLFPFSFLPLCFLFQFANPASVIKMIVSFKIMFLFIRIALLEGNRLNKHAIVLY